MPPPPRRTWWIWPKSIQGSVWKKESFEVLHMIAGQPEGKWAHYVQRILDETDPYPQNLPHQRGV